MSERDYNKYHHNLHGLAGRRTYLSLATNSIKIHIDEVRKGGTYIWIDPPWEFQKNGKSIASSASCPQHEEDDYGDKFEKWCSQFEPIFESCIQTIEVKPTGSLRIRLRHGYEIVVSDDFLSERELLWYDHWYYSDRNKD